MVQYKKNQLIELHITDYSNEGEGIGKTDAFTWFIKDTVIGDRIRARVTKLKKHYGYARLEEVLEASPHRVIAPCPVARACGGCQLQHTSYKRQLAFKKAKLIENLKRIGGFGEQDYQMDEPIGMDSPWRYRNKAMFPIRANREGVLISGFFAGRTHQIIPVEDCLLGVPENREIVQRLLQFMQTHRISAYDEESHNGIVRNVLIRKGFYTNQLMVCIIINADSLPFAEKLVKSLLQVKGMQDISLNINREKTNVLLGKRQLQLHGAGYIEDSIGDVRFRISPLSFYQVNPSQTYRLYSKALEYAALTGKETVWDLYCGIGSISLFLAKAAKQVYGIEVVEAAIADAVQNAKMNAITNASFYVGKAEEVLPQLYEDWEAAVAENPEKTMLQKQFLPDVIVVDPPRKGCDKLCLDTMLKMDAERIVYVSCDCATLARDLRYLCDGGYVLRKVSMVDQFPHTGHVECVVLMTRKDG